MADDDFHVLIIGGGNCGLALATGLKKIGVRYTVFERDSEDDFYCQIRDWGMLLHWGIEYLENGLPEHLKTRIRKMWVDPTMELTEPIPYLDAKTGEVLNRVATPEEIMRVSRRKIRRVLTEGEGLNIEFGKRLRSILGDDQGVQLAFEDGSAVKGSLVVGADGARSKVREFLVGPEAAKLEDVGLTMINFPYGGYTAEEAYLLRCMRPIVKLCFHEDLGSGLLAVLDASDAKKPETWIFQIYTSWWGAPTADDLKDSAVKMKFFKEHMNQLCEPFRSAAVGVSYDFELPIFDGKQWAPSMKWDNREGRVTLAGDAAHSMLPHRGQGLNNAVKDASDIMEAVKLVVAGQKSLAQAITGYEDEMRLRGAREVALSHEQAVASRSKETYKDSPVWRMGHSRSDVSGSLC